MIVFVNGPFGVGKTSVARLLVEEIPDAILYDPEVIGSILRRVLGPFKKVDDYQDYALWRTLVVGGARLLRKASARTLVVPMTVWRRDYFDSVIAGLRRVDGDLACFRLTASRDVLTDRISSDTEDREAHAWRASHVDVCMKALRDPAFGTEIRTDDRTTIEVASRILEFVRTPTG
jgi:predicted kinase